MAEDIQGLITKIQQEGIKAGEDKAKEIENEAQRQAQVLIAEAKKEAVRLISQAQEQVAKMQKSAKASLEQSGRDLLLALREEINAMLQRLILAQVRLALKPEQLGKIIAALINQLKTEQQRDIIISLQESDLKKLKQTFLASLSAEAKKGISLKASGEITGGFIISYDAGKSHFDFTDKGIAEYLSRQLKPELGEILKKK